ncbi:gamma-glutamyltransferase [Zavarzinella formosa]|uniref:gamma-glutamyltransferase n=1 Tax=Zavarzinella formosa TaxID=360055 RepID=UPI000301B152|nr:gamma-glutamyltransferase [Zavarzinella formosa]
MSRMFGTLAIILLAVSIGPAQEARTATVAKNGMVVCVSPEAADVGVAILKKGGNATDASVAVAFAMAVTHPAAGNIGGGGFMMVAPKNGKPVMIDYRETAPKLCDKDTFAKTTSWFDQKAVGVPGTVRGLEFAHKKFGKLPWRELVEPAVKLAEEGFLLNKSTANSLNEYLKKPGGNEEFKRVFGKDGGKEPWKIGDRLTQPDLAKTLKLISEKGPDAFYTGPLAELLLAEIKAGEGYIRQDDLNDYKAVERETIKGVYRGFDIFGPSPPSSGGICIVQMLNMLENYDLKKMGADSADTRHLIAEVMRRSFADRAKYIGDPAFTKIPDFLTTKEHAKKLIESIDLKKVTPSESLADGIPIQDEAKSTTHFSVMDADGNAVSNTYTLEETYGSRVVVRGAGYILNNEMGDFNRVPGVTTRKGGVGTAPNLVAPGKRMLSSQTPVFVFKDGKLLLVTGSPGGRTIINTVLCVVLNVLDFEMDIQAAVNAPRQHHQWFPDQLAVEFTDQKLIDELTAKGHKIVKRRQGDAHSIWIDPKTGLYHGAADSRLAGKAAGY